MVYAGAERVIGVYGMGLAQHAHGFENIAMLINLLLMRGHSGRPRRGHLPGAALEDTDEISIAPAIALIWSLIALPFIGSMVLGLLPSTAAEHSAQRR